MSQDVDSRYVQPLQTPMPWFAERSGKLAQAVKNFISHDPAKPEPLDPLELQMVINYAIYYIEAPCWLGAHTQKWEYIEKILALREQARKMKTLEELYDFLLDALSYGIDPF